MKNKVVKIVALFIGLGILAAASIGLYFSLNHSRVVGKIEFGTKYFLSEMLQTEKFKGAYRSKDSYFKIDDNQITGEFYLVGLEASSSPIPFIVTKNEEINKKTVIHLEYILNQGNDTSIQKLQVITTSTSIEIRSVESHGIQDIITEKPGEIKDLQYEVTIMVFTKEAA